MTTAEVLRAAKALIDTPDKWTREVLARFGNNHDADPLDTRACRFCSIGAVLAAARVGCWSETRASTQAVRALEHAVGEWPSYFNDHSYTTHADVMAAFDRAIAIVEAE